MQLTKEYVQNRLQNTSVHALAVEIATTTTKQYAGNGRVEFEATVAKFEKILAPLAPKTITAVDAMETLGIHVVRVT